MQSNKELVYEKLLQLTHEWDSSGRAGFSTLRLSSALGLQRSNVSALLNLLTREGRLEKLRGRPVLYALREATEEENSCFRTLVGAGQSMSRAVQSAKAAILYPEHALHVLLAGLPGTEKSFFAGLMYQFALEQGIFSPDAPFVRFNCSHYAERPEDIPLVLLTGEGSVLNSARGGLLLIENLDEIPAGLRSQLLELSAPEDALSPAATDVQLIATVNLNDPTALADYRRPNSIQITLPALAERGLSERLALIRAFLCGEAGTLGKSIAASGTLLRCLLLYPCPGNTRQLRADLRAGCARAYARARQEDMPFMELRFPDFSDHVREGFFLYRRHREALSTLLGEGYDYHFSIAGMERRNASSAAAPTIYGAIDEQTAQLRREGAGEDGIAAVLSSNLEADFSQYVGALAAQVAGREQLNRRVGLPLVELVDAFLEAAGRELGRVFPLSVFYALCLHLTGAGRVEQVQALTNLPAAPMAETHYEEYRLALDLLVKLRQNLGLTLPMQEAVLLTLFLSDHPAAGDSRGVLLLAFHGQGTATALAAVLNTMAGGGNVYGLDLDLTWSSQDALRELRARLRSIDRSCGILALYDMEPLGAMLELIGAEEGVTLSPLELPSTGPALECARRLLLGVEPETLRREMERVLSHRTETAALQISDENRVIIALCQSGEGAARQIKAYIEQRCHLDGVVIIPLAVQDRGHLLNEASLLRQKYDILCVVGTYDPELLGIPFVTISSLFSCKPGRLEHLLLLDTASAKKADVNYDAIYDFLSEQLEHLDLEKLKRTLPVALDKVDALVPDGLDIDLRLGLFIHIACAVDRMLAREKPRKNEFTESLIATYGPLFREILQIFRPLEKVFGVVFSDDEVATLLMAIKKL